MAPQSVALGLLLIPAGLCHEHLPVSPVVSLLDARLLHVAVLWVVLGLVVWTAVVTLRHHPQLQRVQLVGLVLIIVPFLPASHVRVVSPVHA